jgi:hypothetical protein
MLIKEMEMVVSCCMFLSLSWSLLGSIGPPVEQECGCGEGIHLVYSAEEYDYIAKYCCQWW